MPRVTTSCRTPARKVEKSPAARASRDCARHGAERTANIIPWLTECHRAASRSVTPWRLARPRRAAQQSARMRRFRPSRFIIRDRRAPHNAALPTARSVLVPVSSEAYSRGTIALEGEQPGRDLGLSVLTFRRFQVRTKTWAASWRASTILPSRGAAPSRGLARADAAGYGDDAGATAARQHRGACLPISQRPPGADSSARLCVIWGGQCENFKEDGFRRFA